MFLRQSTQLLADGAGFLQVGNSVSSLSHSESYVILQENRNLTFVLAVSLCSDCWLRKIADEQPVLFQTVE